MIHHLYRFAAIRKSFLFALVSCFISLANANTTDRDWELGVGVNSQLLADYRGSVYYQAVLLPFPYLKFKSKYLQVEKNSVKSKLYSSDFLQLSISGDSSFNVDADKNKLRLGMDELHPTFELGPSLDVNIGGGDFNRGWIVRLPLKTVTAVDIDQTRLYHVGLLFNPRFTYLEPEYWSGWDLKANLGLILANEQYHEYYYGVSAEQAIEGRPEYTAKGGYSGFSIKSTLRKNYDNRWFAVSLRLDLLDQTSFAESPLVQSNYYVTLSFTSALILKKSSQNK